VSSEEEEAIVAFDGNASMARRRNWSGFMVLLLSGDGSWRWPSRGDDCETVAIASCSCCAVGAGTSPVEKLNIRVGSMVY
jgi:hypothetical protein